MLPKVKAYHEQIGVPFRHWQFDSWFYPKDGGVNAGGGAPYTHLLPPQSVPQTNITGPCIH